MTLLGGLLVGLAAGAAGAINAVAGGGTLLTFPALIGVGLPPIAANATNTAALAPAAFTGAWSFRERLQTPDRRLLPALLGIGVVGACVGSALLLLTPEKFFARLVPLLILGATLLFAFQDRIRPKAVDGEPERPIQLTLGSGLFLLGVAIYGGYFGAGIGILTLAALGLLGLTDIHRMNAVKAIFTGGVNGVSAAIFVARGLVHWQEALLACGCAMLGAWAGAGVAKRMGGGNVRRLVVVLGVGMAIQTLWKFYR